MIEGRAIAIDDKNPDLDYGPASEAMLDRMKAWADTMKDRFPDGPARPGCGYEHAKIPVESWLVTPPIATDAVYRRCGQYIIEAAINLSHAKPDRFKTTRVAAIIGYPDMFGSEVCVFFDPDYWKGFADRNRDDDHWTPLPPEQSLARRLSLKIPAGFREQGYHTYSREDDVAEGEPPYICENETWIYSEILNGD